MGRLAGCAVVAGFVLAGAVGCTSESSGELALGSATLPGGVQVGMVAVGEGDRIAAGYLVATADGVADQLVDVTSPAAARVSLHRGDGAAMEAVEAFAVPAGGELRLVPGGDHLMLEGLVAPLVPGEAVPLTLRFASGGTVEVTAPVVALVDVLDVYDGGW